MKQSDLVGNAPQMQRNFCEIFNNNTSGVKAKVGRRMAELQHKIENFDGKLVELQGTMVKFSGKNNRVTAEFVQK